MLIQALCDYYDILARARKVLPEGYSSVKIDYLVSLTGEGRIDAVIPKKEQTKTRTAGGKSKEIWISKEEQMPQRTEKPGIDANVIEHRPLYLFGLNYVDGKLSPEDRTDKARKSHEAFVRKNLEFTEGIDTPAVLAYRQFIRNWNPEEETENPFLLKLGKDYGKSGFAFCLSGYPDQPLHQETAIRERWEKYCQEQADKPEEGYISQCAVSGRRVPIARIHSKIRGVAGGLATGSVLVGFNNASESSYGKEQSYNSNISEAMMKKYTEALNYLLAKKEHKMVLDDITVVFWAMDEEKTCEEQILAMVYGQWSDQMDAKQTQKMIQGLLEDGKKGALAKGRLQSMEKIKADVDFYMLGLKPNSSRLALKFIYRRSFAEVLWNIARFQEDMQISKELYPVSFGRIRAELLSPKNKNAKVNPELLAKLFEAIINGTAYPEALLATVVRRVKTDTDSRVNAVRAGLIKACINRKNKKEELSVALNKENDSPAYLCGY